MPLQDECEQSLDLSPTMQMEGEIQPGAPVKITITNNPVRLDHEMRIDVLLHSAALKEQSLQGAMRLGAGDTVEPCVIDCHVADDFAGDAIEIRAMFYHDARFSGSVRFVNPNVGNSVYHTRLSSRS